MRSVDVVVVGGGPAGAATAMLLARAGLDTVVLERQRFPRAKPCGDCLSPNATRLLMRLDVLDAVEALRPARLEGWRLFAPAGHHFEERFDRITGDPLVSTAIAVSRSRLDHVLLTGAERAGAEIRTGFHVTGLVPDTGVVSGTDRSGARASVRARLVVGADGLRSVIARRTGAVTRSARLRKVSLTAHVTGLQADAFGEMHIADGLCAGLAPVSAGPAVVFNLTVVADARRHARSLAHDPLAFFHAALGRFPALADRVRSFDFAPGENGTGRLPQLLASGPFDVPVRDPALPGVTLVGDAAGYYDPFTGQGINQALAGAFLLAEEALPQLLGDGSSRPMLDRYGHRLRTLVRGPRLVQRIIETVVARTSLADRVIGRLALRPDAARALLAATGDLAPAHSVFSPAVLLAVAGWPMGRFTRS